MPAFQGSAAVLEYMEFGTSRSPLVDSHQYSIPVIFPGSVVFSRDGCEAAVALKFVWNLNQDLLDVEEGTTVETLLGVKMNWNVVEGSWSNVVLDFFFSEDFLERAFHSVIHTREVAEFMCGVMTGQCKSEASDYGGTFLEYSNVAEDSCVDQIMDLPETTGAHQNADGNSFACRAFHSILSIKNPLHCPHISFAPMKDSQNKEKCQATKNGSATDLFSRWEIRRFHFPACVVFGLPCDTVFKQY